MPTMQHANSICPGPRGRREFLRAGVCALGGFGLADVLARRSHAGHRSPPQSAVILFWMWGGPSQLETWDMKPDAPSEYRGPFSPIATNVPGLEICEIFPLLAQQANRFAVVRSLHHEMSAHNDGSIELLTGKTPSKPDPTSGAKSEHPDFGMIASRMRGLPVSGLPQYVGIPLQPFMTRPVYLGMNHKAFDTGDPSVERFQPRNLNIAAGLNGVRLNDRRTLVAQLDRSRRDLDLSGTLEGIDKFRGQAFQLLTSDRVAQAFDLDSEDPRLRDRYGRHLWGQSCLLARRLAEAGVAVITIDAKAPEMTKPVYQSWDDHSNPRKNWGLPDAMIWRARFMDPALATLIDDIHARGLDRDILVVAVGEFGRTPRLTRVQGYLGRDHWPQAQAALISGGGLRMGQAIGATTGKAEYPTERPLSPRDLLATIYRHLGIDPSVEFNDTTGRPHRVLYDGEPIRELV